MIAYKLFKIRKDGSIGSLFINASEKYKTNVWIGAEFTPTKGFAERKGWHCLLTPVAPHLKMRLKTGEIRGFYKVEIDDYDYFTRPESQGGKWVLAQRMKILEKI